MRICVLETDINNDDGLKQHGHYPEMFRSWLSPALPEAEWSSVAVHAGANLPEPGAYDAYLITGSRHGAYDPLPWIAPLEAFLRQLRAQNVPVGGICFGHQIMAQAYGARVEKSDQGWLLGAQSYAGRTAFAMHQDQVQEVPDGTRDVTSAERCAIARLAYAFPALSVQYHPEFSRGFMESLLDMYSDGQIDPARISAARATLDDPLHVDQIAEEFAAFFRTHTAVAG